MAALPDSVIMLLILMLVTALHLTAGVKDFDVELAGHRATYISGTIKIYYGGEYHYMCQDFADGSIARVICRQLGFRAGTVTTRAEAGDLGPELQVMPRPLLCTGYEQALDACRVDKSRIIYPSDCYRSSSAGVKCEPPESGTLRLIGGDGKRMGTLEVWQHTEWGSIADFDWDDDDATVACKQLEYKMGGKARYDAYYGQSSGPIWMTRVGCAGSEAGIIHCYWEGDNTGNHSNDAGVDCTPDPPPVPDEGTVKLMGGAETHQGVVQAYISGDWRLLCVTRVTQFANTVDVICRQLGWYRGIRYPQMDVIHSDTSDVWSATCWGSEKSLSQCQLGHGPCPYPDAAAVSCMRAPTVKPTPRTTTRSSMIPADGTLRLADGGFDHGRVEIFFYGQWGTICDNAWDNTDAGVVCKTLGLGDHGEAKDGRHYGPGKDPIWLYSVDCLKNHETFSRCRGSTPTFVPSRSCDHTRDAGVDCSPAKDKNQHALAIGLGVTAAVLAISFLAVLVVCCRRRYNRNKSREDSVRYDVSHDPRTDISSLADPVASSERWTRGPGVGRSLSSSEPTLGPSVHSTVPRPSAPVSDNTQGPHVHPHPSAPPTPDTEDLPPAYYDLAMPGTRGGAGGGARASPQSEQPPSYESLFVSDTAANKVRSSYV